VSANNRHPLRINVGFLLHESVGTSRQFDFDHPAVQVGEDLDVVHLRGAMRLTRTGQGLYAQGRFQATVSLECVRCLTNYEQGLETKLEDLFVYPPSHATEPLLAVPETGILDLNPLLREYFWLDMPIQPVCRPDCRGLCPVCGNNLNESTCQHTQPEGDPRLAGLKSLLSKS
jgi:uncharacterized protein